jgi:thymidylate kinase
MIVAFEGLRYTGKTTTAKKLVAGLNAIEGVRALYIHPFELVDRYWNRPYRDLIAETEGEARQSMMLVAHAQAMQVAEHFISERPLKVAVIDRSIFSFYAYGGMDWTPKLMRFDNVVWMSCSPEERLQRANTGGRVRAANDQDGNYNEFEVAKRYSDMFRWRNIIYIGSPLLEPKPPYENANQCYDAMFSVLAANNAILGWSGAKTYPLPFDLPDVEA